MTRSDTMINSTLGVLALGGLAAVVLAGCASGGSGSTAYQRVAEDEATFRSDVGCPAASRSATAEEASSRRKPPMDIDACQLLDGWGVPDRVDRINVGDLYYQTWLYDRYTVIIRREGSTEPADGTLWNVIYSG